ncbi:MAG: T9SS type A sorting domain-containing protein [Saprospiraceae bacterium]|nr:T9SS type A sorting domain-containing protein [Saprospiraceae bacterium]
MYIPVLSVFSLLMNSGSFSQFRFYFNFLICLLSATILFSQQWKDLYHFIPSQTLNKIKFYDNQFGITAGSLYNGSFENIHLTKDGGKTWKNSNSGYTSMRFMDIFIQDTSTLFMSGNNGIIIRSTDGGNSWKTMNTKTTEQLWGIHFIDANIGISVGSNGTILRSINGGTDWSLIQSGMQNLFYDVYFTKSGVGFASGSNVLYKSIDSGENWFPILDFPFESPADWIRSIKMVNEDVGYACADIGRIYKTMDGGDHWIRLNSGTQEALFDLDFTDITNGMVCGFNGTILSTKDGGLNWIKFASPLGTEHLYSIDMTDLNHGFICTHTGHILYFENSTTHEQTFTKSENNIIYPNPCKNSVHLKLATFSKLDIRKIELCNLLGNCISVIPDWSDNYHASIDLEAHFNGIYYLQISTDKITHSLPISIIKNSN